MGIKHFRPYTPSRRNMTTSTFEEITKKTPEKSLLATKRKNAGRNSYGRITVRHQGGGNRQKYRITVASIPSFCLLKSIILYFCLFPPP